MIKAGLLLLGAFLYFLGYTHGRRQGFEDAGVEVVKKIIRGKP